MALDGIFIRAVTNELKAALIPGVISKIAEPEKDELLLTVSVNRRVKRLSVIASPETPIAYLREDTLPSPKTAPAFLMSLRKHIGGGRITDIFQPSTDIGSPKEGLERIIVFKIEHLNELYDPETKYLSAELMGKYSNIVLLDHDFVIIDSLRHISNLLSSVREVLPGRTYFIPDTLGKEDPVKFTDSEEGFSEKLREGGGAIYVSKKIVSSFTGISPAVSLEMLFRAGIEPEKPTGELSPEETGRLFRAFSEILRQVVSGDFEPNIVYDGARPEVLSAIRLKSLEGGDFEARSYGSASEAVRCFYESRAHAARMRQKSEDLRNFLKTHLIRAERKLWHLEKEEKEAEKGDICLHYGELIKAFGYRLTGGEDHLTTDDFLNDMKEVRVPLDPAKNAYENAEAYFSRYKKMKRRLEALAVQIPECRKEISYLEDISRYLEMAETETDIDELRYELREAGYRIKSDRKNLKTGTGKGKSRDASGLYAESGRSTPLTFTSSDGIPILVGRNNIRNEELTFRLAGPSDWWFHAKNVPGSHVIARTGASELPDRTCLEAAALAAYYSAAGRKAPQGTKIEVDYCLRKNLRKVPHAPRGFVTMRDNYSVMIEPRKTL